MNWKNLRFRKIMQRDADFHIRMPRETLQRIEAHIDKDPSCPSRNHWLLEIINETLDRAATAKSLDNEGDQ
jgi:hypothetical protein